MPKEILEISNVSVKFGDAMILKNISFSVNEKEIVGIIGPNGCGKTTLLNAISGFVPLESGTISYNGQDIMDLPPYKRAQLGIGRSFQHAGIFRDLSVEDNIVIGLEKAEKYPWYWMFTPKFRNKTDRTVKESLEEVDLLAHRKSLAGILSGGQIRLLELARLKLFHGNILLIDEPTAGVAPVLRTQLAAIIRKLNREHGFAIVVIEHNLKFLFDLVDKVVVLVDGEKYMEGKPEEIQKDKRLQEIYFGGSV
ncbi:MAG: Branched-chain amino acid transport ATP-binding protein [Parcubacteria group bacterium GW2011_GWC2_39_14]|nr:MAG: Branched-chain amino acid transport ATP-binding protein [Parcubacteria group bacterium GW2011_GWC2_39_14]KKR53194.1 MAG: Branched-chain amino acid transport ATP-binding protein [Parcubacteria group bacterium GW2011_GWA2_40_23]